MPLYKTDTSTRVRIHIGKPGIGYRPKDLFFVGMRKLGQANRIVLWREGMDFETLDGYFRGASAVAFCGGMRRRGGSPWDGTLPFRHEYLHDLHCLWRRSGRSLGGSGAVDSEGGIPLVGYR